MVTILQVTRETSTQVPPAFPRRWYSTNSRRTALSWPASRRSYPASGPTGICQRV